MNTTRSMRDNDQESWGRVKEDDKEDFGWSSPAPCAGQQVCNLMQCQAAMALTG